MGDPGFGVYKIRIGGENMKIINIKDQANKHNKLGVDAMTLYDKDSAEIDHVTIKPGEEVKEHVAYTDVVFYVLEGKGTIDIGSDRRDVEKDMLIECPAEIPHRWRNGGNEDLRYLIIKAPKAPKDIKFIS
jgi:mannose-6-phosphate isomerase-like protein (cupin superfamily)